MDINKSPLKKIKYSNDIFLKQNSKKRKSYEDLNKTNVGMLKPIVKSYPSDVKSKTVTWCSYIT